MSFQKKLSADIVRLNRESEQLQKMLNNTPEGKLIIRSRKNGRVEYYHKTTLLPGCFEEKYISADNSELAVKLAWKRYAALKLNDIQKMQQASQRYLDTITATPSSQTFLETHPLFKDLIYPLQLPTDERYRQWMQSDYPRKLDHADGLKYPTIVPQLYVRSKSEADIAARLVHYGVPFHFEEALNSGGIILYPDFKCICLSTGKFFWWEHQGKWDDEEYVKNNVFYREQQLYKAGLIPWKNLIITTETLNEPLDIQWIDEIIKHYLL